VMEHEVTHPTDGIYLPKFIAGILSAVLISALLGGFANLWYLNAKAVEFEQHIKEAAEANATRPGALSRREWELERRILTEQLRAINAKLDEMGEKLEQL